MGIALKRTFFVFIILIASGSIRAQVFVIPQGGLNLSEFSFIKDNYTATTSVGYQAGALARFGKNAFLQTGLLFSQFSNEISYSDSLINIKGPLTVRGLLMPLQVGFNLYNADIIRLRIMAGINLSFPLTIDENVFLIEKSNFKTSNIGAAIGFGFDIFRFVMDANFSFGMNDMASVNGTNVSLKLYTFSIGYLIGDAY